MADVTTALLNGVSPSTTGTFYSRGFSTRDLRDISFFLLMPTTTGTTSTLDISIEEFDTIDANGDPANAERIRTISLTSPAGSVVSAFTQVVAGTSSPNATLQQKLNSNDNNLNKFIRVKYVVTGTATHFTNINVIMAANQKV
jgi:hypothetical protein